MKCFSLLLAHFSGLIILIGCADNNNKSTTSNTDSSKAQAVDLSNALFTTPTIENALPDFKEKTDSCFSFHEDDWRQVEFISKNQKALIDKEIEKIKNIVDNQSQKGEGYIGYKSVAVRTLIPMPLSVDFPKLKSFLTDEPILVQGLGLDNNSGQVSGGFFFNTKGVGYYGIVDNTNTVKTLGIYSVDSEQEMKEATIYLAKFMVAEDLYLVDWTAMNVFDEVTIKTDLVK